MHFWTALDSIVRRLCPAGWLRGVWQASSRRSTDQRGANIVTVRSRSIGRSCVWSGNLRTGLKHCSSSSTSSSRSNVKVATRRLAVDADDKRTTEKSRARLLGKHFETLILRHRRSINTPGAARRVTSQAADVQLENSITSSERR